VGSISILQGFLCLVFGVRVVKFAVGVNGVCVEMVPVLVYINWSQRPASVMLLSLNVVINLEF
jgi:hypothetical protein